MTYLLRSQLFDHIQIQLCTFLSLALRREKGYRPRLPLSFTFFFLTPSPRGGSAEERVLEEYKSNTILKRVQTIAV